MLNNVVKRTQYIKWHNLPEHFYMKNLFTRLINYKHKTNTVRTLASLNF